MIFSVELHRHGPGMSGGVAPNSKPLETKTIEATDEAEAQEKGAALLAGRDLAFVVKPFEDGDAAAATGETE